WNIIFPVIFQVIEASDIVLEVLDARDPLGCRCPQVEQLIQTDGKKKLLLVLNKIGVMLFIYIMKYLHHQHNLSNQLISVSPPDLVPKENLEKWVIYLNKEFPTVAFKSAIQLKDKTVREKKHTKRHNIYNELTRASLCFGSECLLRLLQEHSTVKEKAIQVGVVGKYLCISVTNASLLFCICITGFPNVGKSSIINSLKEMRACNVGPDRGLTKLIVHIDKNIKMLDSPCIIAAPSNSALALALRSTTDYDGENLVNSIDAILKHCNKQQQTVVAAQQEFNVKDLEEENRSTIKASKCPSPASSIVFQSPGFTAGITEDRELPEEVLEPDNIEGNENEDEDFIEGEDEGERESDTEDVEEDSDKIMSGKTTAEELETKNENLDILSTGKQIDIDKLTAVLDDAYDFNTDYI
ncbi:hypothetical protein JD844_012635, partial [Phrynosoma platyrhinos]